MYKGGGIENFQKRLESGKTLVKGRWVEVVIMFVIVVR